MNKIEVKHLCFSYDGNKNVINDISFNIPNGKYVSIVGHNGSGKSTLAKLLIGLLEKSKGVILLDNESLNEDTIRTFRKKISLVFQNPDNQFIGSTVEDDIAFGLENRCIPTRDMQPIIDEFAKEVGMFDQLKKEPSMLSGGQKQRVAIAGALALSPEVVIFDEATSMLDPKGKAEIAALIKKLKDKNPSLTIISITHDIEEAFNSDEVIVLSKGQIVLQGNPNEVLSNKAVLTQLGLDVPFILDLKQKAKDSGIELKSNDIDSLVEEIWALK